MGTKLRTLQRLQKLLPRRLRLVVAGVIGGCRNAQRRVVEVTTDAYIATKGVAT